jgi:type IV pilus assembly protein PilM
VSGPSFLAESWRSLRRHLVEPEYPLVSVEVRPRSVSVVRLAREAGKLVVAAAASVEVPEALLRLSITQPNVVDADAFGRLLAGVLERAGALRDPSCALVLPDPVGRMALLPANDLTAGRKTDLVEMARFRLRRAVPFEIRDAQVSVLLPPLGAPEGAEALVAAMLIPVLEGYEAAVRKAGLEPGLVELASLALLSLPEVCSTPGDRILVNWDEGYASLVLTRDGWPMLVRTFSDAAATPEALVREAAHTILYYRERMQGPGLSGAFVRSAAVPPDDAVALLREPLGVAPVVLDPLVALDGPAVPGGQALAGAAASARRRAGAAA